MKNFLIINLFLILIFSSFINTVQAITVTDDILGTNISEINSILENKIDTTNPNYLTEIVDENGNVPAYAYYPNHTTSRSIKELKAYDGKIFMGLGDWNDNTGPVKVIYYDTADGKIKASGTINDEAIQIFNIIDDKLYTTGCDPRDAWGYGSYYIYNKETNTWDKHMKNDGWIHVFNIVEFKDKLYMCGSTVDTMQKSSIQSSSDNGETFESVPVYKNDKLLPYDSSLRCYNLAVYNNKLYGYIGYSSYAGIYEYDEVNNRFDYIGSRPSSSSYNGIYFEYTTFNDQFIYISGTKLYTSTDLKTFTKIDSNTEGSIRDAVVYNDTLYALSYTKNSRNNYTARIYSTKDLIDFNLLYEFKTNVQPFSLEYYDNNLYIGTIYDSSNDYSSNYSLRSNPVSISTELGALFKIDLSNTKKSINLDSSNKTIEISDNGKSYTVEYDLSTENPVFKISLAFDNAMTEKQWKQEYSNIRNLNLVFAAIANSKNVDFDDSTAYFNNILLENTLSYFTESTTAVEYAKEIFYDELNIQDNLFTLTTTKISESENEYKTQVTLTINKDADFSNIDSSSSNGNNNTNDNNTSDNNTNNNNASDNNTNNNNASDNNTNNNNVSNNNTDTNTDQNNNSNSPSVSAPSVQEVLIIPPSKTNYDVGEKLDLTGLKITVIYPDNTIKEVTKGYTVKGYNKNKSGLQTVTISYEGFSRSYNVKVGNVSTGNSSSSNTSTNTTTNTNINNNINSEVNNLIDNNKLSQTKKSFELKNLLQIIIVFFIITIAILIIKYIKAKKE